MNQLFKKTAYALFTLLVAMSYTQAIEAEYKNSLIKVELQKTSDSSCNINLYTQKNFAEPIKVIKKSDLNYYILLPETSNVSSTTINSNDIRNVTTKVYPYAGADIQNGYTKIDINTTKPLNFSITTKGASIAPTQPTVTQKPVSQPAAQKPAEPKKEVKTPQAQPKKQETPAKAQVKQEPKQETKPQSAPVPKKEVKQETKEQKPKTAKTEEKPQVNKETKKPQTKAETKVEEKTKPKVQAQLEEKSEQNTTQEETQQEEPSQEEIVEEVVAPEVFDEEKTIFDEYLSKIKRKLSPYKKKIEAKALNYGLSFDELLLMAGAASATFLIMLLLLSRKPKKQPKLKSKADLTEKPTAKKVAKKQEDEAKYFVFDDKTRPTAQKKNYELSTYNPKKNAAFDYKEVEAQTEKQESEIINKILKEDSYSEINIPQTPEVFEEPTQAPTQQPQVIKDPVVEVDSSEPMVLSSIEIAPHRGFMCVLYNGNVNLMGYIFDDVFALFNFKQPELNNYTIKFRLTEKTEKGANFIVKVDKTKLLIGVTKNSMTLEVAM